MRCGWEAAFDLAPSDESVGEGDGLEPTCSVVLLGPDTLPVFSQSSR